MQLVQLFFDEPGNRRNASSYRFLPTPTNQPSTHTNNLLPLILLLLPPLFFFSALNRRACCNRYCFTSFSDDCDIIISHHFSLAFFFSHYWCVCLGWLNFL